MKIEPTAEELASMPLSIQLTQGDNIRITFECESLKIEEAVQNTIWNGRMVCLYFMVQLPKVDTTTVLTPKLRVFVNAIPAGVVVFKLNIENKASNLPLAFAEQKGSAFSWAFLSYAHEDRVEVLKAAQLMGAMHIRYFQDVLSEAPGEKWRKRLFSEIDNCDVFLLFWSKHARESNWVIEEAKYALELSEKNSGGSPEIVPVLLEGPPPPPPPPSLSDIHFNDPIRYAIFAEEAIAEREVRGIPNLDLAAEPQCRRPIQEHAFRVAASESRQPQSGLDTVETNLPPQSQIATSTTGPDALPGLQPTSVATGTGLRKTISFLYRISSAYPTVAIVVVLAAIIVIVNLLR